MWEAGVKRLLTLARALGSPTKPCTRRSICSSLSATEEVLPPLRCELRSGPYASSCRDSPLGRDTRSRPLLSLDARRNDAGGSYAHAVRARDRLVAANLRLLAPACYSFAPSRSTHGRVESNSIRPFCGHSCHTDIISRVSGSIFSMITIRTALDEACAMLDGAGSSAVRRAGWDMLDVHGLARGCWSDEARNPEVRRNNGD